ncbi:hypothetical protein F1188_08955 [Roseospira marina]|uniref:Uncharacterized protein n=1 Tax=Roseospira marina TaxID=140057 RepID=A0A5M6IC91_9PROT|nr:hypothetical protein [Roseospira marina]KAA5605742.1 hypothetical protein F1188_08955 [Roseospira marina]MBB4313545.1 uncharacterized membrane protein YdcZ (DUF606 family) [Roseospira marina]MBB5086707.1 uncharacterized membrane protein YdcZ (DUF606 family) [Roseospira marina]
MPATPKGPYGRGNSAMNTASLLRLGLFGAFALLVASTMPPTLMLATFQSLVWIGAIVSALVAAFRGEALQAPHLTRWDEAAVLMAASLLMGAFVDHKAVMQNAEALRG